MDTNLVEEIRDCVYKHGLETAVAKYADTLANLPGESAGIWLRVSSGTQDEAGQLPDIIRHCFAHGYRPAVWYVLHDKSASKGEQQAKLDEMIAHMRLNVITVSVCWDGDRLERRGGIDTLKILADAKDAGGRVEAARGGIGLDSMGDRIASFVKGEAAHDFIVRLTEGVKIGHDRIKANGAAGPGGIPWGYKVTGVRYNKKLTATDLCREFVPQIFARCIAGDSTETIADWLDSTDAKPKRAKLWNRGTVLKILHNMVYAGRWQNEDKTVTIIDREHCDSVITLTIFNQAQDALASSTRKRGPVNEDNHPLLSGLKCNRCDDSPMNRLRSVSRSGKVYFYYRCTGRGTKRKGCGNMVPLERLEIRVVFAILRRFNQPHTTKQWVEGINWEDEIAGLNQDIIELARNPLAENWTERITEKQVRLVECQRLSEENSDAGHYEPTQDHNDDGSVKTIGQFFFEQNRDGRRTEIASHDIRAEKDHTAPDKIRLFIDGDEDIPTPFEVALLTVIGSDMIRLMLDSKTLKAGDIEALLATKGIPDTEEITNLHKMLAELEGR
jgi:DNA invertase Pin-like site-specific DNA recombinase